MNSKLEQLIAYYTDLRVAGKIRNKKEFAELIGVNYTGLTRAMNGDEQYLTDSLLSRVTAVMTKEEQPVVPVSPDTVPLLPTSARGGLIGDFAEAIQEYQCERVISPVKGATLAMTVTGDSMSPEYPSGSTVLMKKIDEEVFVEWGEVYVLDTTNGPVIKRIRKTPDPHVVECVSINPGYQPYTLDCRYINGWYRVLMVMSIK